MTYDKKPEKNKPRAYRFTTPLQLAVLLLLAAFVGHVWAIWTQPPDAAENSAPKLTDSTSDLVATEARPASAHPASATIYLDDLYATVTHTASTRQPIEAAARRLAAAETEEQKQESRAALRKLLVQVFDQDMQAREQKANEIAARIATLRRQYEARMQVKDEIIDLQLKLLENKAAGLEFPTTGGGHPGTGPLFNDGSRTTYPAPPTTASDASVVDPASPAAVAPPATPRATAPANPPESATAPAPASPVPPAGADPALTPAAPPANVALPSGIALRGDVLGDYELLRRRIADAEREVRLAEYQYNSLIDQAKQENDVQPNDASAAHEYVVKGWPHIWNAVERARREKEAALQLLKVKLQLLDIDVQAAANSYDAAERKVRHLQQAFASGAATQAELDEQIARRDTARLEIDRTTKIQDLFKTISAEATATEPTAPYADPLPAR